jgi:hypothetical protein
VTKILERSRSTLTLIALMAFASGGLQSIAHAGAPTPCPGDCSGDDIVAIDELLTLVNIATGKAPTSRCAILNEAPRIEYLVQAVNRALRGCAEPTPTPPPGPTPTLVPFGSPCRDSGDCDFRQFCLEPDGFRGCGDCLEDSYIDGNYRRCSEDVDCQDLPDKPRCEPFGDATHTCMACSGEVSVCLQPACESDDDCDAPAVCEQHRCVGRRCTQDQGCPGTHRCAIGFGGQRRCEHRPCSTDNDCGGGVCVNQVCHAEPGSCLPRPS